MMVFLLEESLAAEKNNSFREKSNSLGGKFPRFTNKFFVKISSGGELKDSTYIKNES